MTVPKIKEVIVVEGKKDTQAIQRAVDADTIETNGSALSDQVLNEIERAWKQRGVIVFTDPDAAGERIRRMIAERIPGVKHAFLPREQAMKHQKVGIEFSSKEAILQALERVRAPQLGEIAYPISWEQYMQYGLMGKPYSSQLRQKVADQLGIGYGNAKSFYRRLAILRVSQAELMDAIQEARRSLFV